MYETEPGKLTINADQYVGNVFSLYAQHKSFLMTTSKEWVKLVIVKIILAKLF